MKKHYKFNIINFSREEMLANFSAIADAHFNHNYSARQAQLERYSKVENRLMNFSKDSKKNKLKDALAKAGLVAAGGAAVAGAGTGLAAKEGIGLTKNPNGAGYLVTDEDARKLLEDTRTTAAKDLNTANAKLASETQRANEAEGSWGNKFQDGVEGFVGGVKSGANYIKEGAINDYNNYLKPAGEKIAEYTDKGMDAISKGMDNYAKAQELSNQHDISASGE